MAEVGSLNHSLDPCTPPIVPMCVLFCGGLVNINDRGRLHMLLVLLLPCLPHMVIQAECNHHSLVFDSTTRCILSTATLSVHMHDVGSLRLPEGE